MKKIKFILIYYYGKKEPLLTNFINFYFLTNEHGGINNMKMIQNCINCKLKSTSHFRINEIKESFNYNIKEIENSKNIIINKKKQETILQVNPNNFFSSNNIISEHLKTFNLTINEKIANLSAIIGEIKEKSNDNLFGINSF